MLNWREIKCRRASGGAVAAVLALALTAGPGATLTARADDVTINVIWQPSGETGYYYANVKNLWAQNGLKLNPIKIATGAQELSALASGSADIAYMGGPPTVAGLANNIDLAVIFAGQDNSVLEGLYANPKGDIRTIKDMVGKRIAVPKSSTADVGMHLSLQRAGIKASDVKVLYMSPGEMLPAYQRGDIDGAWVWDAWGGRLLQAGAARVVTEGQFGVHDGGLWVVRRAFAQQHADLVARFVAVLDAGAIGANKDPQAVVQEYGTLTGVEPAQALEVMKRQPALTSADLLDGKSQMSFTNKEHGLAHHLLDAATVLHALGEISTVPANLSDRIDVATLKAARKIVVKQTP
ncbi:MAG: taurine ABC transporter substrate-binding protein [Candidatus Velthaea sp.]